FRTCHPAELLQEIERSQMQRRVLDYLLSLRDLLRFLSCDKVCELDLDCHIRSRIDCQAVHSHCKQVRIKSEKMLFLNLCHRCPVILFRKLLCFFLSVFHPVVQEHLVVKCLLIAHHKRHPGHSGHDCIELARFSQCLERFLFCDCRILFLFHLYRCSFLSSVLSEYSVLYQSAAVKSNLQDPVRKLQEVRDKDDTADDHRHYRCKQHRPRCSILGDLCQRLLLFRHQIYNSFHRCIHKFQGNHHPEQKKTDTPFRSRQSEERACCSH